MTPTEIAEKFKVTSRTAYRWIKAGAPVGDDSKMKVWIEERQSHWGRSKFTAGEPRQMPVVQFLAPQELTDSDYDFATTDRLISNLSAMASRAARDLEAARLSGSGSAVARASKIFCDSIHELRQSLVQRDQLARSAEQSFTPSEIAYCLAGIFMELRHLLGDSLPALAEQDLWDRGLVASEGRAAVVQALRDIIASAVFPCLSETGAHLSAVLSNSKRVSTLEQRRTLFEAVTQAWQPVEGAE